MKSPASLVMVILCIALAGSGGAAAQHGGLAGPTAPQAPVGSGFTYQGQLTSGGSPINATCDFQFSLHDALSGGAQVGTTQTLTGVSVAAGHFTVLLNGADQFGPTAFTGSERWLAVAVKCPPDGSFTPLAPRQALTASPYTLYALAAPWAGLVGVPAGFADNTDNDTTYSAGFGLGLSGTTSRVLTDTIQARVGGDCGAGSSIRAIDALGSVTCETDDVGAVGSFWSLTGNAGAASANFLGTTDNMTLTLKVNGTTAFRFEPTLGVPNVLGGSDSNTAGAGVQGAVIGGGIINVVNGHYNTIAGGYNNSAAGDSSTVAGGINNEASDDYAAVGGGYSNAASNIYATVAGGFNNDAGGDSATVGGGYQNTAGGAGATVAGGGHNGSTTSGNRALGSASTIGGGYGNTITTTATYATVGGGQNNTASGLRSTVGGGVGNTASGTGATVGGGGDDEHLVGGNEATGAASTVGGGLANDAKASYATVAGGAQNYALGWGAAIGGGVNNVVSPTVFFGTVGGGVGNLASGAGATVGGGGTNGTLNDGNEATGAAATVGGGYANAASGQYATIGGGSRNIASGDYATMPGGILNEASGRASFAAGAVAHAVHELAFVWSCYACFDTYSSADNQFVVQAAGGFWIGNGSSSGPGGAIAAGQLISTTTGAYLSTTGLWTDVSDRNAKMAFAPVNGPDLLDALMGLPIESWAYKAEAASVRHIGPTAQDFHAAFGVGADDTHLAALDTSGVALAAIQGLYTVVLEKDAEIAAQDARITALETRLVAVEAGGSPAASHIPSTLPWLLLAGLGLLNAGGLAGYALAKAKRA